MRLKLVIIIFVFSVLMSSCRKNYICRCDFSGTKYEFYSAPAKYNKSEAKDWCNNYAVTGGTCSLK